MKITELYSPTGEINNVEISQWDIDLIKSLNKLGEVAFHMLDSSSMKDRTPLLYYHFKDLSRALMNSGKDLFDGE